MAFRKRFSGNLFGQRQEKKDSHKKHLSEQEKEDIVPGQETGVLELPPEHPLNELWSLYKEQRLPAPVISFEAAIEASGDVEEPSEETPPLLPADEIVSELARLQMLVTGAARRRLARQKTEEDELPPDLDAQVQIFLTISRVTAWILVYPPSGSGAELTRDMLERALESAHVTYGIDEELLNRLPSLPNRYFHLHLAACGEPPLHGKDGYIIDLFSRRPIRVLMEDESGQIDYSAKETFQIVEKGDIICHIVQPTPCKDGKTVSGEICYARAGQTAFVPKGRNTELNEDGDSLLAACKGHVEFSGRSFQVKPVMDIGGNVDFSTGDINYLGDIHIHGDVCSGFSVRASGNITVDGVIEASVVEAGSDLVVRKGVQGNNRAILHAHRNIYAKYLESCNAYARENLEAECIVNCNVYCDNTVVTRSGRGTIIGGKICAAHGIDANIVGARSECRTAVILGGKPCEAFERECLTWEIGELEKDLEKLSRQPDSPAKPREMARLRVQISANELKLRQFDKELENIEETEDSKAGRCRMVCGVIYPGVEITIDKAYLKVVQETSMCTAVLKENEICLES